LPAVAILHSHLKPRSIAAFAFAFFAPPRPCISIFAFFAPLRPYLIILFLNMAIVSAQQMAEYLTSSAEPELTFILSEVEVPLKLQYDLVMAGYKSTRRFAAIEDTKAEVRAALKDAIALDPAASAEARLGMALLVAAWDLCQASSKKDIELRAESRVTGLSRHVPVNDRLAMRKILENKVGKLPDDEVPGTGYLTFKLEEVESNDPKASPLEDIAHLEHSMDTDLTIGLDSTGAFRTVRKKTKVDVPLSPEHYRKRMRVECNLWMMVSSKFSSRAWLQAFGKGPFENFVDYVLGKHVWDLGQSHNTDGAVTTAGVPSPSWELVLAYEFAMRKAAFRRVREDGCTLTDTMTEVIKDQELRSLYFLGPLLLSANQRSSTNAARQAIAQSAPSGGQTRGEKRTRADRRSNNGKGHGGKGQGKAQGKASGKGQSKGGYDMVSKAPDGRDLCYKWNAGKDCDGKCSRVHACRIVGCMATHRAIDHK
jgi:hypothetical protein